MFACTSPENKKRHVSERGRDLEEMDMTKCENNVMLVTK